MKKHRHSTLRKPVRKMRALHPYLGSVRHDSLFDTQSSQTTVTSQVYKDLTNSEKAPVHYRARSLAANATVQHASNIGYEEIVSMVGGTRSEMKNCLHLKHRVVNVPYLALTERYNSPGTIYVVGYKRSPYMSYNSLLGVASSAVSSICGVGQDQDFSSRAYWSMRPRFAGEVSLINSIFELKDFKDILNISNQVTNFKRVAQSKLFSAYQRQLKQLAYKLNISKFKVLENGGVGSYGNLTPGTLKTLARDTTGTAAATVLTMNLAIKPTIADYLAISANLLQDASEVQQEFKLWGDEGSSSHFSEEEVTASLTNGTLNNFYLGTGMQVVQKRTASMRSYYNYKMRSHNQALLRYWGLTGTAEALWNMLPLSFVSDYIFTVGKALSAMEVDRNVNMVKTEYCESLKTSISSGVHLVRSPRVHALVVDNVFYNRTGINGAKTSLLVAGTECTRYERKVMEPYKGLVLPKFKVPSTSQAVNMLALLRCLVS